MKDTRDEDHTSGRNHDFHFLDEVEEFQPPLVRVELTLEVTKH